MHCCLTLACQKDHCSGEEDRDAVQQCCNYQCYDICIDLTLSPNAFILCLQVTVIKKGETECYECQPKATQKTYPICTIRSTPDKPVHCIVWAKELWRLLFGREEDSMLYEDPAGGSILAFV